MKLKETDVHSESVIGVMVMETDKLTVKINVWRS